MDQLADDRQRLSTRHRAVERVAFDQLYDQVEADIVEVQTLVWLTDAMERASRSKRSLNCSAETLMATSRERRASWASVDLAHTTCPDGGEDFVRTEFRSCGKTHFLSPAVQFSTTRNSCGPFSTTGMVSRNR